MAKWEVGPVELANGSHGYIHFVQPENDTYTYIGRAHFDGAWVAMHWSSNGNWVYGGTGHDFNLKPKEKKTVRVRGYLNVYANGTIGFWKNKDLAEAQKHRFACILIDREVEEGEGLS